MTRHAVEPLVIVTTPVVPLTEQPPETVIVSPTPLVAVAVGVKVLP